jgi:hypothetical protein
MAGRPFRRGRHEPFLVVIKVPGAKVTLTREDIITIAQALTDAEGWRRRRIDQFCRRCETAPGGRCDAHAADLILAGAYADLAGQLAGILPEPPGEGATS